MAASRDILENPTSFIGECMESGLESALTQLSLKTPEKIQEGVFILSSFATSEFLGLLGIGAGFTSPDMTGFALAQINQKLEEIKAQIKTILGAPAIAAFDFLQRGILSLQAGDNALAYDEFKEVVKLSIQGRIYQKENLKTVVNLTQYVIFADIMIHAYSRSKDVFLPYEMLESPKKLAIKSKITLHLEKLLETQERQKPNLFFRKQKEEKNQDLVDTVLKSSLQFLCPPGTTIPIKFVPEGMEDAALLNLEGKPGRGGASSVCIWKEKEESQIRVLHFSGKKSRKALINYENRTELLLKANNSGLTVDNSSQEVQSSNIYSEFQLSCESRNISLLKVILTCDIDVNAKIQSGRTALMLASDMGFSEGVALLLQHPDIQVNVAGYGKWTALHRAAIGGHLDVTKALIEAGADLMAENEWRRTPLHAAVVCGRLEVVKVLVEAGADVQAVDMHKQTPAMIAKDNGYKNVVKYLNSL